MAYLNAAVSIRGHVFYHPCDGSAAAIEADKAAKGRGDYPYQHLYEGDDVIAIVESMQAEANDEGRISMNNLWDLDWVLVEEHQGVRLFQAGQTWAVCRPGVEPGDADSGVTGSLVIARRWFDDLQAQAQRFLIEGQDEGGHWSTDSVGSLVVRFASREEAEAAIADLTRTLGWDRARLRVVEAGA